MNYTKGEWKANYHEPGNEVQGGLAGYSVQGGGEGIAYNICHEANAHLIAAAPNMYEALKELMQAVDNGHERIGAGRGMKINDILAKAGGR